MSLLTTFYNLIKPQLTDSPPDITDMNPNWDKIDTELHALGAQIDNLASKPVAYTMDIQRDISLSGVQVVTTTKKPKNIQVRAFVSGTTHACLGSWSENGLQRSVKISDGKWTIGAPRAITLTNGSTWEIYGNIQNVTGTGFEIAWNIPTGTPTGTALIQIDLIY